MYGYPAQPSIPSSTAVICRMHLQQALVPTQEHRQTSQGFEHKEALPGPLHLMRDAHFAAGSLQSRAGSQSNKATSTLSVSDLSQIPQGRCPSQLKPNMHEQAEEQGHGRSHEWD